MNSFFKKLAGAALIALVVTCMSGLAAADTVTYSTTALFGCGSVGSCLVSGGGTVVSVGTGANHFTLTASGQATTTVTTLPGPNFSVPYSNIHLGAITSSAVGTGGSIATGDHLNFQITITQTNPTNGTDTLVGIIVGTVTQNGSTGELDFLLGDIPASIGDERYYPALTDLLVAPNSGGGVSTIEGVVLSTPEPASLALMGSGMLMGGNFIRRKLVRG